MPKLFEGQLSAQGKRFAVVASRFNEFFVGKLLDGAIDCIVRHGGDSDSIEVYRVPGAFELPLCAARIVRSANPPDAVVCLGVVLKGATDHNIYVATEATKGIAHLMLETGIPIGFGVVTADTLDQAIERAGSKAGNKGADAALSAIEMLSLFDAAKI